MALKPPKLEVKDLDRLVKGNQKSQALNHRVSSEEAKTGYLTRSFLPKLNVIAGQEEFSSDRLGDASSSYYGVDARVNVFNGMSDRWEERRREANLKLERVKQKLSHNEMVLEAKKAYLKLAEIQNLKTEIQENLKILDKVSSKVRKKVRGGVISKSDLTLLRLVKVELEHKVKDLDGQSLMTIARLRSLISNPKLQPNSIDKEVLTLSRINPQKISKTLLDKKYKLEADEVPLRIGH